MGKIPVIWPIMKHTKQTIGEVTHFTRIENKILMNSYNTQECWRLWITHAIVLLWVLE